MNDFYEGPQWRRQAHHRDGLCRHRHHAMIGSLARVQWLSWIAIAVIVLGVLREPVQNIDARRKENSLCAPRPRTSPAGKFVASLGGGAANGQHASRAARTSRKTLSVPGARPRRWKGRKTAAYLKCPNCGQMLSVPKGQRQDRVTCPKCHAKMETRSGAPARGTN